MKRVNPILQWWVTPKLPYEDIFERHNFFSQWVLHPVRRRLSRFYLKLLQRFTKIKVVAVTGSAGKSTTVQMLASILGIKAKVWATIPSIDPVYNIPNAILQCPWGAEYLILEMSVEYVGEMDYYLWLARPDVGMILNIYPTHTQFFKNEDGVFSEKKKLVESLSKESTAILNRNDKRLRTLEGRTKAEIVWLKKSDYEIKSSNEFTLTIGESKVSVQLPILGRQFIQNAVAAAVCARQLGASIGQIKQGLEGFTPPEHRMRVFKHRSGAVILDDSYNNNPVAAKEALKAFLDFSKGKRKIVVLGDMLELGKLEEKSHREIGEIIGEMDIDFLIGVGKASRLLVESASRRLGERKTKWVGNESKVINLLSPLLNKNSAVLIKGSRSVHLERVVERLLK